MRIRSRIKHVMNELVLSFLLISNALSLQIEIKEMLYQKKIASHALIEILCKFHVEKMPLLLLTLIAADWSNKSI